MISNEKSHISSIIASLNKAYSQSKLNGQLNTEDIYILDSIYKLLNNCETSLTDKNKNILEKLYRHILYTSKYICKAPVYKSYFSKTINTFVQEETGDCNTLPIQDLIYYWQEPLGITDVTILENIAEGSYLNTKTSDLKSNFIEGKNINYIDIGLICFALNNISSTDQYFIYDDDNNANVTEGFESFYNDELKTRIFISYNIYSHGIMNFKIKKL